MEAIKYELHFERHAGAQGNGVICNVIYDGQIVGATSGRSVAETAVQAGGVVARITEQGLRLALQTEAALADKFGKELDLLRASLGDAEVDRILQEQREIQTEAGRQAIRMAARSQNHEPGAFDGAPKINEEIEE